MATKKKGYTHTELLAEMSKGLFRPVYFLEGAEPYYIDLLASAIEEKALPPEERSFNQTVLYGADLDLGRLINECKRFPMMAQRQVVIVREAQEIRDLEKYQDVPTEKGKQSRNLLEDYVKKPLESTVLVLCYKHKKLDGRKGLAKVMEAHAVYFRSEPLRDYQIPAWISAYCKEHGIRMADDAIPVLAEYLGTDLAKIQNELQKLIIGRHEQAMISREDVMANIGISRDYNTFEFQDALAMRQVLRANQIARYFAEHPKENPIPVILSSLYTYFAKIIQIQASGDLTTPGILSRFRTTPKGAEVMARAARAYSPAKLRKVIGYLREYDLKFKGVDYPSVSELELLQELVFKVVH
jgi:DNA polymerase-3 subunit delta